MKFSKFQDATEPILDVEATFLILPRFSAEVVSFVLF